MVLSVCPDHLWAIQTFTVGIHEASRSISKPMQAIRSKEKHQKCVQTITFGSAPVKYYQDMLLLVSPCPPFSSIGVQTCIVA